MGKILDLNPTSAVVRALLPSLGFFGGTWADCLEIELDMAVTRVRIDGLSRVPEFLNLGGILARKNGRTVDLRGISVEVLQSSDRPASNLAPQSLDKRRGIHTLREDAPWWEVRLGQSVEVDKLLVFNRADGYGTRARRIQVSVTDSAGHPTIVADTTGVSYYRSVLRTIESFGAGPLTRTMISTAEEASQWRAGAVRAVATALRQGGYVPSASEWLHLATLIPTVRNKALIAGDLEGEDWFLLAFGLSAQLLRNENSRSGVQSYSRVLHTAQRLRRLDLEFTNATRALAMRPVHHVRHGVSFRGQLRESAPEIARLVEQLRQSLLPMGYQPLLAYGSLLGAEREGHLLEHDDDFDLFVTLPATSETVFLDTKETLVRALVQQGWQVEPNTPHHNMHLRRDGFSAALDLFAVRVDGPKAWTHMSKMEWVELPSEWFAPGRETTVDGISVQLPQESTAFLTERYGESWNIPDKFHDWRWKLEESE